MKRTVFLLSIFLIGTLGFAQSDDDYFSSDDDLFGGSEGVVTKIDRRKERARVDFRFDGGACHTWVALEDVRPADGNQ